MTGAGTGQAGGVKLLRRLGAAIDSFWDGVDPDEPLFCDCCEPAAD